MLTRWPEAAKISLELLVGMHWSFSHISYVKRLPPPIKFELNINNFFFHLFLYLWNQGIIGGTLERLITLAWKKGIWDPDGDLLKIHFFCNIKKKKMEFLKATTGMHVEHVQITAGSQWPAK